MQQCVLLHETNAACIAYSQVTILGLAILTAESNWAPIVPKMTVLHWIATILQANVKECFRFLKMAVWRLTRACRDTATALQALWISTDIHITSCMIPHLGHQNCLLSDTSQRITLFDNDWKRAWLQDLMQIGFMHKDIVCAQAYCIYTFLFMLYFPKILSILVASRDLIIKWVRCRGCTTWS